MRSIAHFSIRICAEASQIPGIEIPVWDFYSGADAELEVRRACLSVNRFGMEEKMKRVKAACICQTLHFMLKEDISHEDAVRFVAEEVAHYKKSLERNRTQYKIVEETTQPDGSIMIKIKKQYNQSPVGDYLNE